MYVPIVWQQFEDYALNNLIPYSSRFKQNNTLRIMHSWFNNALGLLTLCIINQHMIIRALFLS